MTILNADILATIIAFASPETIPSMMLASRFFYHEGPRALLQRSVRLDTDQRVARFVRFVGAEDGRRSRYVTELFICFDEYDDGVHMNEHSAELLSGLFQTSSFDRLAALHIDSCEKTLVKYPSLLVALKTLPNVRKITLDSCGLKACDLVNGLGGRLTHAMLKYSVDEAVDAAPVQETHPLTILQSSRDTLRNLDVHFMDKYIPRSLYPPPFPNVVEFELAWCHYPLITPYVHALPNLQKVHFETTLNAEDTGNVVVLNPHRQENRSEQLKFGSWRALDYVYGRVADVYISGLICEVRHLVLFMGQETFEMLGAIVEEARPFDLSLNARAGAFDSTSGLSAVLRGTGAAKLEALKLNIQIDYDNKDMDLVFAMADLISSLQPLPLREFELVFTCFGLGETRNELRDGVWTKLPPSEVEQYLLSVDLEDLATRLLAQIPTMQLVVFSIRGLRSRKDKVVASSNGAVLTIPDPDNFYDNESEDEDEGDEDVYMDADENGDEDGDGNAPEGMDI
ncbi:hypothetical protein C2E23DRAFT_519665 [Lenzites betulinus]|nr:hypothetical protein C2E23DRAFT_519665 [Lenzites betulinus]